MKPLKESPFSFHFNALTMMGSWLIDTKDPLKFYAYIGYRTLIFVLGVVGVMGLLYDFVTVIGEMKKMTWNLSVTILLVGSLVKIIVVAHRNKKVKWLRLSLHHDAESRQTPEDLAIQALALKEFNMIRTSFYGTAIIFMPVWFISRYSGYFYGVKELPIPFRVPPGIDLDDDLNFHIIYFFLGFSAIFGMVMVMETELSMYSLLVQISREYRVFHKDIPEIDRLHYDEEEERSLGLVSQRTEVNPHLKYIKTKMMVKRFSARQKTLIEYTETFESVFNEPLFQQFFAMSVLIVFLALQCLWESVDLSWDLFYQIGYLYVNVMDMFLMCLFSTRLRTQCLEVGEKLYSTLWYRMGADLQKDIAMIILRSQHPPKITIGKFMELSLNTFMNTMSNLYSWLALFRQLE